jgi:hypothetical protein
LCKIIIQIAVVCLLITGFDTVPVAADPCLVCRVWIRSQTGKIRCVRWTNRCILPPPGLQVIPCPAGFNCFGKLKAKPQ